MQEKALTYLVCIASRGMGWICLYATPALLSGNGRHRYALFHVGLYAEALHLPIEAKQTRPMESPFGCGRSIPDDTVFARNIHEPDSLRFVWMEFIRHRCFEALPRRHIRHIGRPVHFKKNE